MWDIHTFWVVKKKIAIFVEHYDNFHILALRNGAPLLQVLKFRFEHTESTELRVTTQTHYFVDFQSELWT